MDLSVADIVILLFILLFGIVGFKEGIIKKLSSVIGLILVVILAFGFKNKISVYFYENLPFLNLWGIFKGIQSLNIIFYEVLAFIIIASVLMLVYNIILGLTGLIQKVLNSTIVLSIPSRILGFIVGLVEGYIWTYVILFILTLVISVNAIHESKTANFILGETPVLSEYAEKTLDIYNNIYEIVVNRKDKTNEQINEESMDLMLKYEVITVDSAEKLIDKNKVDVSDRSFLEKYKN